MKTLTQVDRIIELIKVYSKTTISDEIIKLDVEELIDRSCNYIQNSVLPVSLERTIAKNLSLVYDTDKELLGAVQVKEGQTTVTYNKPIDYDTIFDNMKQNLMPFRRLPMERLLK